ncbi:MAG: NADH-quinone oxidoreductase subunit NuoH [Gammaproteobacteria bacterium]|nr:NADH-quinone oxidoreductase subunit NuoH [Gammaproteobacteria bacterium]|tara:strand:+ start:8034 stop:8987 length:954 start_codon:yes stop_codon:yes gene_type:complete
MDWINWSYVLIVPIAVGSLIAALVLVWWERRLLGWWQDRLGPNRVGWFGVLQALADAIKLFTKDDWIPPFGDRVFFVLAPFIVTGSMLMAYVVLPLGPGLIIADSNIAVLWFLAMSSLAVYGVLLAGLASNNKYALLGGLRAAAQMVTYEVFMGLSLMGVVIHAQSFSLVDIVNAQEDGWFIFPQVIGFFIFTIAGLAESHRLPFDLPEAEHELTAGFHTEYSGMKFGLIMAAEYLALILTSAMITVLFLGGWHGPEILPPVVWFGLKVFLCINFFILLRAAIPRPRYDQLMSLGWKILLPLSLLNVLVTGAVALST